MKEQPFDKAAYDIQYNRDNIVTKRVPFNRQNPNDMQLLDWSANQSESFTAYVKRLIAKDLQERKQAQ